jgi:BirA family transcriptional regulator, biotin operon repressor / biotin---[acetyl-CoA-carboxylase] ligase
MTRKKPAAFTADEIRKDLKTKVIGRRVVVLAEAASTQDEAKAEAATSSRSGTVIFAEAQTRGRGRFQRVWQSEPGKDLTFSVVLRAPHAEVSPSLLTVTASVAVCETVVQTASLPAEIKWPNDVLIRGRKVAGILVERTQPKFQPTAFILGIGLNVNSTPALATASSLSAEAGEEFDRVTLAKELLRELDYWFEEARLGNVELIAERWRKRSATMGRRITLIRAGKRISGRVIDISPAAGLTLELDSGKTETFKGEHVTVAE